MTVLAVVVSLLGLVATATWFGVSRRRKEEAELGVEALATMKWRDCIALVLEALHREGYPRAADTQEEAGATEFMLEHEGARVLLGYKHGTAYRLGEANVREFAANVRMRGAREGILCTLGTLEPDAAAAAEAARVELFDGRALWRKLRPLVPEPMLREVRGDAVGRTRWGLWLGAGGSLLAGLAIFAIGQTLATPAVVSAPPHASVATPAAPPVAADAAPVATGATAASVPSPPSDQAMLRELQDSARRMEEVSQLTPEQRAERRADTARQLKRMGSVDAVSWSGPRTLTLRLNHTDGKDKALLDDVCRAVIQHEELRYTRIQIEPPEGAAQPAVRWRLCE
jgi:hypothetical protein